MNERSKVYREYLLSDIWREKRRQVLAQTPCCQVPNCFATKGLEVHHTRYPAKLGKEPLSWLLVLCVAHHRLLHRLQRERKLPLRVATRMVLTGVKEEGIEIREGKEYKVTVLKDGIGGKKQQPFMRNHNANKHKKRRNIGRTKRGRRR